MSDQIKRKSLVKMFDEKLYQEARMVAEQVHAGQRYDKIFPYTKHLDDVVDILRAHGFSGKYIIAGYLHDSMEDGNLSYKDISSYFGDEVAEIVYAVTDELGRNRKERKLKTLPKIAANKDAIIIKLADRIANIRHGGKKDMYIAEYKEFKSALYSELHNEVASLWSRLDELLMDS